MVDLDEAGRRLASWEAAPVPPADAAIRRGRRRRKTAARAAFAAAAVAAAVTAGLTVGAPPSTSTVVDGLPSGGSLSRSSVRRTRGLSDGRLAGVAVDLPVLTVPDLPEWARWLEEQHTRSKGVWLTLAKKGSSGPIRLSYDDALTEALCYGWIDGRLGGGDDRTFRRTFTPRRPGSAWSRRNVTIATMLIEEGRMRQSGLAAVSRAQADGTWEAAYDGQATIEVPPDLAVALGRDPAANAMFDKLSGSNRYSILYRVTTAKRPDTRRRRIEQLVAMLARGDTIHPQRDTAARRKNDEAPAG